MRGLEVARRIKGIERNRLIERALNKKVIPISLDGLEHLKHDGTLSLETFKDNIGKIFPLILHWISEGKSYQEIADLTGLGRRTLIKFLYSHSRLKVACENARKIKLDKKELERIELHSILDT